MNTAYREIPEIRYQLSMYGWTVEELDDYLVIDMKGDIFYVPYPHINDVGVDSIMSLPHESNSDYAHRVCNLIRDYH